MHEIDLFLPRSAFSPREAARAGDVWRLFQDVAVAGSIGAGWTPARYREASCSMIVRSMIVLHHRETIYGEILRGRTWPSSVRRGMFFRRECRITTAEGPVASATQEWVHVATDADGQDIAVARASEALLAAFPAEDREPSVALPEVQPRGGPGRAHRFELECWHGWMDPLGHVNHPAYVDWCDEALSRAMAEADIDPVRLAPVAERVAFRSGVVAGERAVVETRLRGTTAAGHAVFEQEVSVAERVCAKATAVRRLVDDSGECGLLALG